MAAQLYKFIIIPYILNNYYAVSLIAAIVMVNLKY